MASGAYTTGISLVLLGTINLNQEDFQVLMVTSDNGNGYTYDPDDVFIDEVGDDVAQAEMIAVGYSRQTLTGTTVTVDNANNRNVFDAPDVNFGSPVAGDTGIAAIITRAQVTDDTDTELLFFVDIPDKATDGNPYIVVFNSVGIATITMA